MSDFTSFRSAEKNHQFENPLHSFQNIAAPGWPDDWAHDWYVCDGAGGVDGPLPAQEIFAIPVPADNKRAGAESGRRFVSRRGFAQWYDAEDFSGLFQAAGKLSALATQALATQTTAAQALATAEIQADNKLEFDDEIMQALAMAGVNPSVLASPVDASAYMPENLPENLTAISPRIESGIIFGQREGQPLEPRLAWLAQRGKSRLGDLRNPLVPAFLTFITCGIYYIGWLLGAMREVVWHIDHDTIIRRHISKPWMVWIPGLHIKATWDFACLIRTMEEQDGYTSTRPVTAAFLSVVPPLAAIYLQHAMNDHWLIHCLDPLGSGSAAPKFGGYLPMQNELNTTSSTSSA